MPVIDVSNPIVIHFLLEHFEKESQIRMKWVSNHASKFAKASKLDRAETNYTREDIITASMVAGIAATTRDNIAAARFKIKAPEPDYKRISVKTDLTKTAVAPMKPTAPDLKDTLQESRKEYLKKRYLLKPEEKYKFIECSNWRYGWKLNESMLKMRGPEHGKINHVMYYSHSRVGPQRDPDHYRSPEPGKKVYDAL